MNECKRVSDCPADRLAQCRGQAVQARCDALQGLLNKADQQISDLTHAATVPPAGDVEVLGWIVSSPETRGFRASKTAYLQRPGWAYAEDNAERYAISELVDRDQVTRLTAERDGLQSLYDDTQARLIDSMKCAKVTESELTKARFLVDQALHLQEEHYGDGMGLHLAMIKWARAARPDTHNVDESGGQDAEAEKGETDE